MKTIFTSLLAMALMFALCGCCAKNGCASNTLTPTQPSHKTC